MLGNEIDTRKIKEMLNKLEDFEKEAFNSKMDVVRKDKKYIYTFKDMGKFYKTAIKTIDGKIYLSKRYFKNPLEQWGAVVLRQEINGFVLWADLTNSGHVMSYIWDTSVDL